MWKLIETLEVCGDDVPVQSVFVTADGRTFRTRAIWKWGVMVNDQNWIATSLREFGECHRDRVEHFLGPQEVVRHEY